VSCLGVLHLERHWWGNRCPCPTPAGYHVDACLGLEGSLSRRLQRQVCRLTAERSFQKAQEDLVEAFGVHLSAETLRQLSVTQGQRMARWQPQDQRSAALWQAARGAVEFAVDAGKVNTREEGWKDLKIAVLQKRPLGEPATAAQWDQQRLPAATARWAWGAIASSKCFRKAWRAWLKQAGVEQMAEVHVLADGADWIWKSVDRVLTGSLQTLDIYHALEHVAQAGQALYGEGTPAAEAFLERGRQGLLTEGWTGVCRLVGEEYAHGDTPERRTALEKLLGYFVKHTRRLGYAQRLQSGRAIGSGAVEGQAKTLGLRLKARGARWKKKNVPSMTALVCVRHSDQWETYWRQSA
jgi:hypothetical protein